MRSLNLDKKLFKYNAALPYVLYRLVHKSHIWLIVIYEIEKFTK